ncbi:MAG: CinA family protein, partial [Chloroflexota bacterium]|nr:CinA family protein [Chloroflexota bacterium]
AALAWGVEGRPFAESSALSPQAAAALARAALRLGASLGLGLTVPSGGEGGTQAGVGFLCVSDGVRAKESRVWAPPHRADTRRRLASAALFHLRRFLLETG